MNKPLRILFLAILTLMSVSLTKPVFAIVPQIENVVVYNAGPSTFLNITVYHYPEETTTPHYVDIIQVTFDGNTTDLHIGVQPLTPQNTFTISYDLGPISGNPTALVKAHCTVDQWSSQNWSGQVPEFSLPLPLLAFALIMSVAVFAFYKFKSGNHK